MGCVIKTWIECKECFSKIAVTYGEDENGVLKEHQARSCARSLRKKVAEQAARIERLEKFISDAPCPYCDGSGIGQIAGDEWEECIWCHERKAALDAAEARKK